MRVHPDAHPAALGYSAAPAKKQAVPNIITFDQGVELAPPPEDYKIVRQMQPAVFNGKLIAWDPVKQKAAWSVDYPSMPNGGTPQHRRQSGRC